MWFTICLAFLCFGMAKTEENQDGRYNLGAVALRCGAHNQLGQTSMS